MSKVEVIYSEMTAEMAGQMMRLVPQHAKEVYRQWPIYDPGQFEKEWDIEYMTKVAEYGFYEQENGRLALITAWEDKTIVGYVIGMDRFHHHLQKNYLFLDAIFIEHRFRKTPVVKEMLDLAEEVAANRGHSFIMFGGPTPVTEKFQQLGWTLVEAEVVKKITPRTEH